MRFNPPPNGCHSRVSRVLCKLQTGPTARRRGLSIPARRGVSFRRAQIAVIRGGKMADAATLNSSQTASPNRSGGGGHVPTRRIASFAMLSHRGRVRRANQDACGALAEHGAFVVCDGMGGAAGGEVASRLATEVFLGTACAQPNSATQARARLAEAIRVANQTVYRAGTQKSPGLHGMGTTLVTLLPRKARSGQRMRESAPRSGSPMWATAAAISSVRASFRLLTQDHSLVEEQVRAGAVEPGPGHSFADAQHHHPRHWHAADGRAGDRLACRAARLPLSARLRRPEPRA